MHCLRILTSAILLCIGISKVHAQQPFADFFVVSTYNHKTAIATGFNRPAANSNKRPYEFLYITVDSGKNYKIQEIDSYQEGVHKFYKRRNTVLFVHGDGANIDDLVREMSQIPTLYNVNVILFLWPAQEVKGIGWGIANYFQAKDNASYVFDSFIHTVNHIRSCDSVRQGNITLMFHSMGNLFAKEYAHYVITNIREPLIFDNIILNAPAVMAEGHELWADVLALRAKKNVYIDFNKNDGVLRATDIFLEHQPLLGREVIPPYSKKSTYVDFSNLDLSDDSHTYFIAPAPERNKNLKLFYEEIMNGRTPRLNDITEFTQDSAIPNMYQLKAPQI